MNSKEFQQAMFGDDDDDEDDDDDDDEDDDEDEDEDERDAKPPTVIKDAGIQPDSSAPQTP